MPVNNNDSELPEEDSGVDTPHRGIQAVQARSQAEYLVHFVQKKQMTLQQAAEMLEACDEAVKIAHQKLQTKLNR